MNPQGYRAGTLMWTKGRGADFRSARGMLTQKQARDHGSENKKGAGKIRSSRTSGAKSEVAIALANCVVRFY